MITQDMFKRVLDLFEGNNLFVIPTFQRPFAWEAKQVLALIHDIKQATQHESSIHYLAPMHLIRLNTRSKDDVRLLQTYMDTENEDLKDFTGVRFQPRSGG